MKVYLQKFKRTLKKQAKLIRELKATRKSEPYGYVPNLGKAQMEYRIGHIAYCLIRGRTTEQIEPKWKDPNDHYHKYCWEKAHQIVDRAREEIADEIICPGS